MNLETNTISFDLVSELFIDKFDEKVKKLKDDEINDFDNMTVKTIKKNDKIHIFFIKSTDNDCEDGYCGCEDTEDDEDIEKYFNESATHYIIAINEFKVNILEFQTTKTMTYFENILESEKIMVSLVNETMQEIRNEISYIEITEYDTENYEQNIKNKPKYQKLPDNVYPVKISTTTDNNSDKILIELTYKTMATFSAIYDKGNFKDIKVNIKHYRYYGINNYIEKAAKALKAFQYYLYNTHTGNVLYERKYKELIDELWGK